MGEIYNDDKGCFDAANFTALLQALFGNAITSIDDLKGLETSVSSNAFRSVNGASNNVQVKFGGINRDAVYVTKAQNDGLNTKKGDIILDLWRSADDFGKFAKYSNPRLMAIGRQSH